jgi:hypothetical protein
MLKIRIKKELTKKEIEERKLTGFKVVRNGTILELEKNKEGNFIIPEAKLTGLRYSLFFEESESGGGATNTGDSYIVCTEKGEPFRPYYIPTSGHLAGGEHAFFAIYLPSYIVVMGDKKSDTCRIMRVTMKRDGNTVKVQEEELWEGLFDELPAMFDHLADAVYAAEVKCNCYHCREPHYTKED